MAAPAAGYASVPAEALSAARRSAGRRPTKLCLQSVCWRIVLTLLDWKWSPQQISGTLKRMYPTDPTQQVSHETIYTAIYAQPRGELRRHPLIAYLRHGHSTGMSRTRGTDRIHAGRRGDGTPAYAAGVRALLDLASPRSSSVISTFDGGGGKAAEHRSVAEHSPMLFCALQPQKIIPLDVGAARLLPARSCGLGFFERLITVSCESRSSKLVTRNIANR